MNRTGLKYLIVILVMWLAAAPGNCQVADEAFHRTSAQKGVGISTDVAVIAMPVATLAGIIIERDWTGLKQGALTAVTEVGASLILKYAIREKRPDATYVGWGRVYAKKHHWWDVVAGAAIGAGAALIYTRPFAEKHELSLVPSAGPGGMSLSASLTF